MTFRDEASVQECLATQHSLNGKEVEVKRAIRKEEMGGAGGAGGGFGGGYGGGELQPSCDKCAGNFACIADRACYQPHAVSLRMLILV